MFTRKKRLSFSIGAVSVIAAIVGVFVWQSSLAQTKNYEEEFHREIGNALAEIYFDNLKVYSNK